MSTGPRDMLCKALDLGRLPVSQGRTARSQGAGCEFFLQRAFEEERSHYVMLPGMRCYYEQIAETSDSQQ